MFTDNLLIDIFRYSINRVLRFNIVSEAVILNIHFHEFKDCIMQQ